MQTIFDFWEQVLRIAPTRLSSEMTEWLMRHVLPVSLTEDCLTLHVPKPFLKMWLEQNLLTDLRTIIQQVYPQPLQIVITTPADNAEPEIAKPDPEMTPFTPPEIPDFSKTNPAAGMLNQLPELTVPDFSVRETFPINPPAQREQSQNETNNMAWESIPYDETYTFDNFLVGNSNRLAMAAAKSVATKPGGRQNPLFIYGSSGLGKTHLLHAICNHVREHSPEKNIVFLSSENFLNNLISVLQHNSIDYNRAFREKYRNLDYILIDDIQLLGEGDKDATRMEFFHTFNELMNNNKQIVMTCDRLPEDMRQLEKRLVSRFQSGLVVEIQPSDYEMRCAFLNFWANKEGLEIPSDVITFIAENFPENFRSLEGIFTTILTYSSLDNRPVRLDWVREILADRLPEDARRIITPEMIIGEVAAFYKVRKEKLTGKSRPKNIAFPRQVAMYLCRELLDLSFSQIGSLFNRDHTTVIYAYDKIFAEQQKNPNLQTEIDKIQKNLESG